MWLKTKTNSPAPQHGSANSGTTAINLQGFGTPMPPRRRSRFLFGNNHRSHSNSNQWMTSSPSSSTTAAVDRLPSSSRQPQHRHKHHHRNKKRWKIFLWTMGGILLLWMMGRVSFFSSSSHNHMNIPATIHTQTVQHPYQACHLDPPWGRGHPPTSSTNQEQPNKNIPSSGAPCTGPSPLAYPFTTATHLTCPSSPKKGTTTTLPHNHKTNNQIPPSFDVAIAWTYYASPTSLLRQLDHYTKLLSQEMEGDDKNNKWKERRIVFLVIDDGSPPGLQAADYVTAQHYQELLPHSLQLVQIDTNIAWNQPGARNLAMNVLGSSSNSKNEEQDDASSPPQGLILSLDIDVWIPSLHDLERLLAKHEQLSASSSSSSSSLTVSTPLRNDRVVVAHSFNRTRSMTPLPAQQDNDGRLLVTYYKEHPSALAMTALDWWQTTGGMDEDFAGHYGSEDVAFWWKFEQYADDSFHHPSSSSSSPSLLPRRIRYHHEDIILQQLDTLNGGECDSQWIPSTTDNDLFSQCTRAQDNLPSLSRDANLNILKGQKKRKTGCWSNTFLRFPWHFVDRVGVVAPTAT